MRNLDTESLDDTEFVWDCHSARPMRCVACDRRIRAGVLATCCMLCAASYHRRCLGAIRWHACPTDVDAPLTDAELASNETLACRMVEKLRLSQVELARCARELVA